MCVFYVLRLTQLLAFTNSLVASKQLSLTLNNKGDAFHSITELISDILPMPFKIQKQLLQPELERVVAATQLLCLLSLDHANMVFDLKRSSGCLHVVRQATCQLTHLLKSGIKLEIP